MQKVGTRSVAQVRSHAQKYFLKLEKSGNTEEVPPARAKKPASKPYPTKADEDGRGSSPAAAPDSEESGARKLRRTGRHSMRPHRQDFTSLEESPGPMDEGDAEGEPHISEEGNGSNHNGSGSNGQGNGACSQRQSSVLSSVDLQDACCPGSLPSMPSASGAGLVSDATLLHETSDPTDAISGAAQGRGGSDAGQYEELYNLAGKLCGNQDSSNRHMVSQLGSFQREKLVHMLDCLKNEVNAGMSPHGASPPPLHSTTRHLSLPMEHATPGYGLHGHGLGATAGCLGSLNGHVGGGMHVESGLSGQGSFSSNFASMEPAASSLPGASQSGMLGVNMLTLPVTSDLDSGGWKPGMSGDLSHLLPPSPSGFCYHPPQHADSSRIDSKMFDY